MEELSSTTLNMLIHKKITHIETIIQGKTTFLRNEKLYSDTFQHVKNPKSIL